MAQTQEKVKYLLPINTILDNPTALHHLKYFVSKEHSEENLLFWEKSEEFRRCNNEQEMHKLCKEIWNKFFKPKAPYQLTLDSDTMEELRETYNAGPSKWHKFMYAEGQDVVQKVLKQDVHLRFIGSQEYRHMCQRLAMRLCAEFRQGRRDKPLSWRQMMQNPLTQEAVRKFLESIGEDEFLHFYLALREWKYRPLSKSERKFDAGYMFKRYLSDNARQLPAFVSEEDKKAVLDSSNNPDEKTFDNVYDKLKNHLTIVRYDEFVRSAHYSDLVKEAFHLEGLEKKGENQLLVSVAPSLHRPITSSETGQSIARSEESTSRNKEKEIIKSTANANTSDAFLESFKFEAGQLDSKVAPSVDDNKQREHTPSLTHQSSGHSAPHAHVAASGNEPSNEPSGLGKSSYPPLAPNMEPVKASKKKRQSRSDANEEKLSFHDHKYRRFSLEYILNDWELLTGYIAFTKREHSEENVLFWTEVQQFQKAAEEKKLAIARNIFKNYLKPKAEYEIPIGADIKERIRVKLLSKECDNLFNEAIKFVLETMRSDSYQRYINSNIYMTIMEYRQQTVKHRCCLWF